MGCGAITGQSYVFPVPIPDGGTGATTAQGARQNLEVGKTVFGTATYGSGSWWQSGGLWYQDQTINGLQTNMRYQPIIYLITSGSATDIANQKAAFSLLADFGETGENRLRLHTSGSTAPSVNFTVQIVGEVV